MEERQQLIDAFSQLPYFTSLDINHSFPYPLWMSYLYNRYSNILPCMNSVKINGSQYFNGNFFDNLILTQAPLKNTFLDFVIVLIEQQVDLIVILTPFDNIKADNYFNIPIDKYQLVTVNEENNGNLIFRTINIIHNDYILRSLKVIQYLKWNDQDIISLTEFTSLLDMITSLNANKILIHCSAGIGRTGVLAAALYLKNHDNLSIIDCIVEIRKRRPQSIQTIQQFILLIDYLATLKKDDNK
jgi:protein tyrosine phosphatase